MMAIRSIMNINLRPMRSVTAPNTAPPTKTPISADAPISPDQRMLILHWVCICTMAMPMMPRM